MKILVWISPYQRLDFVEGPYNKCTMLVIVANFIRNIRIFLHDRQLGSGKFVSNSLIGINYIYLCSYVYPVKDIQCRRISDYRYLWLHWTEDKLDFTTIDVYEESEVNPLISSCDSDPDEYTLYLMLKVQQLKTRQDEEWSFLRTETLCTSN